jgi:hypothetical protein
VAFSCISEALVENIFLVLWGFAGFFGLASFCCNRRINHALLERIVLVDFDVCDFELDLLLYLDDEDYTW